MFKNLLCKKIFKIKLLYNRITIWNQ